MLFRSCIALGALLAIAPACEQRDPLFCGSHMDDPRCSFGDGGIPEGFVVIGGTVDSVTGSGLVLLNNGSDDKAISSTGAFSFAMPIAQGSTYAVTVGTQPTNPSEMCSVANGSGTANSDVSDIAVTCAPAAYPVGGNVAGFTSGGNIVLTNNGGDAKTITANGAFTFATPVPSGSPYNVQIQSQQQETCSIVANMGTVGSGPVSTVVVTCGSNLFTVGGTPPQGGVTGLKGTVRLHNGPDTINVAANGAFAFPTPLTGGGTASYNVTVTTQPAYPPAAQNCVVSNAAGTVGTANVTNVGVACTTRTFTIGGSVGGLTGGTIVLRNGNETKSITSNGSFTFNTPVQSGFTYGVTVMSNPTGLRCTVSMGSGTVTNANITNVSVACADAGVKCGSNYCGSGSVCCNPGSSNATCISSNASCSGLELPCDDKADCTSGRICCAQRHNGNLSLESVSCQSSCNNVSNGIQLCDRNTNECTSGSCQSWNQLSGYNVCR